MHPQIESIFDNAEARYLKPEELKFVTQYVESLPQRLDAYRTLRDRELEVMQWVVDQLQLQLPQEDQELLERSIKNALLMLRYCSMGMLLDDEALVKSRFISWVTQSNKVYNTQTIDTRLYRLLNQQLEKVLNPRQMGFLNPLLKMAQTALLPHTEPANGAAIGR